MEGAIKCDIFRDLSEVGFQDLAPGCVFQPFDGFFLDLPYPFPGQVELLTDFFQGMGMFPVQSEIQFNDARFAMCQG